MSRNRRMSSRLTQIALDFGPEHTAPTPAPAVAVAESISQQPLTQYIEAAGVVVRIKTIKNSPPGTVAAPAGPGIPPPVVSTPPPAASAPPPVANKEELPALPQVINGELFPLPPAEDTEETTTSDLAPDAAAPSDTIAEPGTPSYITAGSVPPAEPATATPPIPITEPTSTIEPTPTAEPAHIEKPAPATEPPQVGEPIPQVATLPAEEPEPIEEPALQGLPTEEPAPQAANLPAEEPAPQAAAAPPAATEPAETTTPDISSDPPVPETRAKNRRPTATPAKPAKPAKPTASKRGRKSLKQVSAEADLIEIPADEVLFSKQYYTMGEVSEMFRVNQSLLRFWETEFDILQPRKNKKGDRYFRPIDIKNLHLIYHLLRQKKFTIEGAREFLKKNKKAEERFEIVQRLQEIRSFLLEWKAQL